MRWLNIFDKTLSIGWTYLMRHYTLVDHTWLTEMSPVKIILTIAFKQRCVATSLIKSDLNSLAPPLTIHTDFYRVETVAKLRCSHLEPSRLRSRQFFSFIPLHYHASQLMCNYISHINKQEFLYLPMHCLICFTLLKLLGLDLIKIIR